MLAAATPAAARNVFFVDNSKGGGNGSYARPFANVTQAAAAALPGDVIYVAEGSGPYDGSVTLKPGQFLIGAAYGLDAIAVELKEVLDAPPTPAVQGPGPTIHGGVWLAGNNVVAGCTIVAESGSAIGSSAPSGPISIRNTVIRAAARATALYLAQASVPVTLTACSIEGSAGGSGIGIDGGVGPITFDRVPVTGSFSAAVSITNRGGGAIKFGNGSKIAIDDARSAIVIGNSKGPITFENAVSIVTHNGRGIVVTSSGPVVFSGAPLRVAAANGAALEIHDSRVTAGFESVSAEGVAPGVLKEGIVLDKVTGRVSIGAPNGTPGSGGTVRNARLYGMRITQSADMRVSAIDIVDSGSATAECPEDLGQNSNVRCGAGLYLRHVQRSRLGDITITGGGASGITANNLRDVVFDNVRVSGNGTDTKDPSLLIQEAGGTLTFSRCRFIDAAGGGIAAEQRFNAGRLVFDHCEIAAPNRPTAAPYLVRAETFGQGRLQLAFNALQLRDNAGSAFYGSAADASSLSLSINESYAERIGGTFVELSARQPTHLVFSLHDTRVVAPGSRGRSLIDIDAGATAADTVDACIDIAGNELTFGGGAPAIRVRGAHAKVNVAGAKSPDAVFETNEPVTIVGSCQ